MSLPAERFELSVTARRRDGRTAKAERRYQPCIDTKPVIAAPSGTPADEAAQSATSRAAAVAGPGARSQVRVHYVLVTWSNGQEIDSSWDRDEPFEFEIGSGEVIPGFEQGITGMKVGGRREVIVPPGLGYGEQGQPAGGRTERDAGVRDRPGQRQRLTTAVLSTLVFSILTVTL